MPHCFWCDKNLTQGDITKDHLFSRFLGKIHDIPRDNDIAVVSCQSCNSQRGTISSVYEMFHRVRNNEWQNWNEKQGKPTIKSCFKGKKKVEHNFPKFKKKIKDFFTGWLRKALLEEILIIENSA